MVLPVHGFSYNVARIEGSLGDLASHGIYSRLPSPSAFCIAKHCGASSYLETSQHTGNAGETPARLVMDPSMFCFW